MANEAATQDPQGFTEDTLASKIKEKYPKYKDIDNQKLVSEWMKKYPRYGEHLIAKPVGAAPAKAPSTGPPVTPQPAVPQSSPQKDTTFQSLGKQSEELQSSIQRWRPRWDNPKEILNDPTWYGRSSKFLGGEVVGAGKAVSGVAIGTTKLLNDLIASIDPVELYKRPTGEPGAQVGKDVVDFGRGIVDLGKTTYDLLRHFPESSQDPEKFGSTVSNMAMTVDGALKGSKAVSEHLGFTSADAINMAKKIQKTGADALFRQKAVEDAYVHKNGVSVAKDITTAVSKAEAEVKVHTDNLHKIDANRPSGVIDAAKEADVIKDAFKDIVKTPDPMNKALNQMVKDAGNTAPGQWTFEKTRQFRSSVGRAFSDAVGPQKAVLGRVYQDLTTKLKGTSKQFGLEDSWNQYNELEKKINKSFGVIDAAKDIIDSNGEGAKMATALKDKAVANEVMDSLERYGLDRDRVTGYAKRANKLLSERGSMGKRIFNYIYGRPGGYGGLPTYALMKSAGSGYTAALGAGALAGIGTSYLVHAIRAARLSAETLDGILETRKWPGKLEPPTGEFPAEGKEESEVAGPEPSGPKTPPQLPAAPTTPPHPAEAYGVSKAGVEAFRQGQASVKTATLPTPEMLADAIVKKGGDPNFAEKRAKSLIDAASGKEGYSGPERRMAPGQIKNYMGPERRGSSRGSLPVPENITNEAKAVQAATEWAQSEKTQPRGGKRVIQPFEEIPKESGPAQDAAIERIVEKPVQALVKKLIAEGKKTLGSNAYGPGPKGVTWIDEKTGQGGFTALEGEGSRATKQRERVARVRAEKGSTALGGGTQEISGGDVAGEIAKTTERINAPHLNVENLQIPEMEEALRRIAPTEFKELQRLRKTSKLPEEEYKEGLRAYLLYAYEDKLNKPAAD